jgi:Kef-type K+ transport system membrane component KefB
LEMLLAVGLMILLTALLALALKALDQPIIIAYIISGVVSSYLFLGFSGLMAESASIAIALMLFIVGLEFDVRKLLSVGKDIILITLVHSGIFFLAGYLLGMAAGLSHDSFYLGIFIMFSSTFLAAKWVYDRGGGSEVHGRLVLSSLLVQGSIVILARVVVHIISNPSLEIIVLTPLYAALMVGFAFLMSLLLRRLLDFSERYPELLFIVCLTTCVIFIMAATRLNFSKEVGALIAGLVIASSSSKSDVLTRFRPHLVILGMVYFFATGYGFDLRAVGSFALVAAILLLVFSLKPLVLYHSFRFKGYDSRASFESAIYLCQISEVGLTIMLAYGPDSLKPVAILSLVLSMVIGSYLIKYDRQLFRLAKSHLAASPKGAARKALRFSIVFFGFQDVGRSIVESYREQGKHIVVVENDPSNISA